MGAPGPGRDFEGCPKFFGRILLRAALIAALLTVALRRGRS
jgi:hypothetical protein